MEEYYEEEAQFEDEKRELTPGEAIKKILELEVSEKERKEQLLQFLQQGNLDDTALLAFLPTRDIGHGKTYPTDEFIASSDYELSLHLLNLNPQQFKKSAVFFFLLSVFDVTKTRSREGFLIKALRSFWSFSRHEEPEKKEWFVSPKRILGKGGE